MSSEGLHREHRWSVTSPEPVERRTAPITGAHAHALVESRADDRRARPQPSSHQQRRAEGRDARRRARSNRDSDAARWDRATASVRRTHGCGGRWRTRWSSEPRAPTHWRTWGWEPVSIARAVLVPAWSDTRACAAHGDALARSPRSGSAHGGRGRCAVRAGRRPPAAPTDPGGRPHVDHVSRSATSSAQRGVAWVGGGRHDPVPRACDTMRRPASPSAHIAVLPVPRGPTPGRALLQLVDLARYRGARMRGLLADRGFRTVELMRGLRRRGVPSIMPLASRGRLADALHRGHGPHLTTHRVGGPQGPGRRRGRGGAPRSARPRDATGRPRPRARVRWRGWLGRDQRSALPPAPRRRDGPPADGRGTGARLEPLARPSAAAVGGLAGAAGRACVGCWRGRASDVAAGTRLRVTSRCGAGLDVAGECRHHTTQRRRCSHLSSHAVSRWPTTEHGQQRRDYSFSRSPVTPPVGWRHVSTPPGSKPPMSRSSA